MTATTLRVPRLHARAVGAFGAVVRRVGADQWSLPTPCPEWDVRALVNHVLAESRWTAPLLGGLTIAEVGDRLDGDLLGDDPLAAWESAQEEATAAVRASQIDGLFVHLSFGDTPAAEYLYQLTADHLIHSWDLAVAVGADDRLDPELVDAVATWFEERAADYRAAGAVGEQVQVAPTADAQRRLLAQFGRDSERGSATHPGSE